MARTEATSERAHELMAEPVGGDDNVPVSPQANAMAEVAQSRAAQEVQAAMVMAKRFPRDETSAFTRIMKACKRKGLAEAAMYAYPRGGETVTGPSIRLAEEMARSWGNIDFGIVEVQQSRGESVAMAYAWDLETNTRQTKIFTIKHERHTKRGVTALTDPRDIYELVANQGARRVRACILGVIPGDIVDAAVVECEKTLASADGTPLADRVRAMVAAFSDFGVSKDMIEKRLGHRIEVTTEADIVGLKKIYRSLKDNMAAASSFFDTGEGSPSTTLPPPSKEAGRKAAAERAKAESKPEPPKETAPESDPAKSPENAPEGPSGDSLFGDGQEGDPGANESREVPLDGAEAAKSGGFSAHDNPHIGGEARKKWLADFKAAGGDA